MRGINNLLSEQADVIRNGCFPLTKGVVCPDEDRRMYMKNRQKQRKNRRTKHYEEKLDTHNGYGVKDLTAYNAVMKMKTNGKATIALK